jgi:uncharacterized protein (TIGR02301 family)
VLGEAHALKQVCQADDATWRARMQRMLEIEAPDDAFKNDLTQRFNDGFSREREQFPHCDARVPPAEAKVAADGKRLSGTLSRIP